jgi:hypothetical protein
MPGWCAICGHPINGVHITIGVREVCLFDSVQIYEQLVIIKKTFKEAHKKEE